MTEFSSPIQLPVLPLRDIVVFPHMIVPLFVGREKSVKALEEVMNENKQILLLTQTDAAIEDPSQSDMYQMGTVGNILQLLKLPDGTVKVLVEGREVWISTFPRWNDHCVNPIRQPSPKPTTTLPPIRHTLNRLQCTPPMSGIFLLQPPSPWAPTALPRQ